MKHTKKMAARQESKKKNSEEEPAKTSVENEKSKGKNGGKKEELNGKRLSFSPPGTETSQSGYIAECA